MNKKITIFILVILLVLVLTFFLKDNGGFLNKINEIETIRLYGNMKMNQLTNQQIEDFKLLIKEKYKKGNYKRGFPKTSLFSKGMKINGSKVYSIMYLNETQQMFFTPEWFSETTPKKDTKGLLLNVDDEFDLFLINNDLTQSINIFD